jgi:hypothetical protein
VNLLLDSDEIVSRGETEVVYLGDGLRSCARTSLRTRGRSRLFYERTYDAVGNILAITRTTGDVGAPGTYQRYPAVLNALGL